MKYILVFALLFCINLNADRGLKKLQMMKNEQRVALVIGNNKYDSERLSNLKNPINDARAMKNKLKGLGFTVYYGENLSVRAMDKKLRSFGTKLKSGGVGLFYFAGHGVESGGKNYLIGKDSNLAVKDEVAYESLELDKVITKMKTSGNRLNIVLLDACRNDPFSRSGGGGLAKVYNAKGMFIAYATSPGDVASDGVGKHGVFTQEILNHITERGVPLHKVFKNVKRDVYNKTNHTQRPWTQDDVIGEFFFRLPSTNTSSNTFEVKPKTKKPSYSFQNERKTNFTLRVNPTPSNARVSITNIKPRYYDGIKLKKGSYEIKVSSSGYITKKGTITLSEDMSVDVVLDKKVRQTTFVKKAPITKGAWDKSIYSGKRSYSKNTTSTVKDNLTGLIWQKKGSSNAMNWSKAKNYCSKLNQDGYSNWRLPNIKELRYLADREKYKPTIDTNYFKSQNNFYWSSTEYKGNSSEAWHVRFSLGFDDYYVKSLDGYVRCVVGRQ